jgi:hypothetical protein
MLGQLPLIAQLAVPNECRWMHIYKVRCLNTLPLVVRLMSIFTKEKAIWIVNLIVGVSLLYFGTKPPLLIL